MPLVLRTEALGQTTTLDSDLPLRAGPRRAQLPRTPHVSHPHARSNPVHAAASPTRGTHGTVTATAACPLAGWTPLPLSLSVSPPSKIILLRRLLRFCSPPPHQYSPCSLPPSLLAACSARSSPSLAPAPSSADLPSGKRLCWSSMCFRLFCCADVESVVFPFHESSFFTELKGGFVV